MRKIRPLAYSIGASDRCPASHVRSLHARARPLVTVATNWAIATSIMFSWLPSAYAETITATSCSASDVQAALRAAGTGDTVSIPAGTCTWSSQVTWDAPADVTLKGAGNDTTAGGGNATTIVDNYTGGDAPVFSVDTPASGSFRMYGLTFRQGGADKYKGMVQFHGANKKFRVDHNTFDSQANRATGSQIRLYSQINGVFDHNVHRLNGVGNGIQIYGQGRGDEEWSRDTAFGSSNFVFIEDSQFLGNSTNSFATDCLQGGRYVFRYNTLSRATVQNHGTGGSGRYRSCRATEMYKNSFSGQSGAETYAVLYLTGGTALFYDNTANLYSNFLAMHSIRREPYSNYSQSAAPGGWGYCGTSHDGRGSNFDQNNNASTGYACFDQPGRGKGDLLTGDFSPWDSQGVRNATTGCSWNQACVWPRQALEPLYEWNNSWSCPNCGGQYVANSNSDALQGNRDYYLFTTSFNGSSGVGRGVLSSRPSTCTAGVAYFATDNTTLYKCTSPNSWGVYYKSYAYPHPLAGGTSDATPNAPTALQVTG